MTMKAGTQDLVFVPLGGVGEIGMNLALYGYGRGKSRQWIMVDCGISFPGPELPGIDVIMPDIRFAIEIADRLQAIMITHAHEDHYGALMDLWPFLQAPVYATPFAAGLLEAKSEMESQAPDIPVTLVQQGERVSIGPFSIEYVPVSHSIPEPNALLIETPVGRVMHSGDWKIDPTPGVGKPMAKHRLAEIGEAGLDVLICDSTNAIREGVSPSEADVAGNLADIVAKAKGRVAVTTFSSNVARIRAVALAAKAAQRDVVVFGRSLRRVIDVAAELGYLDDCPEFHDEDAFGYLPNDRVVALCTGSQGEPRAALARIAVGDHRHAAFSRGDLVIFSARAIPGNEKAIGAVMNGLANLEVDVLTDRDALVHVSGHPRKAELAEFYGLTRPKALVPVHGEPVHLEAHRGFAAECGIGTPVAARNGDVVRLLPGAPDVVDSVYAGIWVRDSRIVTTPERSGVVDRRRLSFAGAVFVSIVLDHRGNILDDPIVEAIGLPLADQEGEMLEELAYSAIVGAAESIPKPRRRDPDLVADAISRACRSAIGQAWGKKPVCRVAVSVV